MGRDLENCISCALRLVAKNRSDSHVDSRVLGKQITDLSAFARTYSHVKVYR